MRPTGAVQTSHWPSTCVKLHGKFTVLPRLLAGFPSRSRCHIPGELPGVLWFMTVIPSNPTDDWTIDEFVQLLPNMCIGAERSGPPGLLMPPNTFVVWNKTFHATSVWINYFDNRLNGDAHFMLLGGNLTTMPRSDVSAVASSSLGGCVRQALLASALDASTEWTFYLQAVNTGDKRPFIFSSLEFTVETSNVGQSSSPGITPSKPPSGPSAPSVVPDPSSSSAQERTPPSHTTAMVVLIAAGVVATAAMLVAVLWLGTRRLRRSRRSAAACTSGTPSEGNVARSFLPLSSHDPDERDATLFDARIAARSMALYETMKSTGSAGDGSAVPLLSLDTKHEHPADAAQGPSALKRDPKAAILRGPWTVPPGTRRIMRGTRTTAWEEPPPEYSTNI